MSNIYFIFEKRKLFETKRHNTHSKTQMKNKFPKREEY